jgi:hypothetical protein
VCTIENKRLRVSKSFLYITQHSLILKNVTFMCLTELHDPCDFAFNVEGEGKVFEMSGKSSIGGRQVVVENFKG